MPASKSTKARNAKKVNMDVANIVLDQTKVSYHTEKLDGKKVKEEEVQGKVELEKPEVIENRISKMASQANEKNQQSDDLMFDNEFADELQEADDFKSLNQVDEENESQASNLSQLQGSSQKDDRECHSQIEQSIDQIVETVVNKLSTTLQSLCISDRVIEARQSAAEWKDVCLLMAKNPELIEKLGITGGDPPRKVFKRLNADMSDPTLMTLQQFLSTPLSTPIWTLMVNFEITQNDPMLNKWWKRVQNDSKDSYAKLCKYLQAVMHFNHVSEQLWTQMSINPTAWSIQKISIYLTACGDWLRSANLDMYKWSDRYYRTAENVAFCEKTGGNLFKIIEDLWPSSLKGNMVHYQNAPFDKVNLVVVEDANSCVIAPPPKMFKFDPNKAWPEEDQSEEEVDTPKRAPTRRYQYDDDDDQDESEVIPRPLHFHLKRKKM